MSEALRISSGSFGRVALLDMDHGLVRHAHPQCHILLKVGGSDTRFEVGNAIAPLSDEQAVLVDAWTPHSYIHLPGQPPTTILALYIEPEWLASLHPDWAASGEAGFFEDVCGRTTPAIRMLARGLAGLMTGGGVDPATVEERLEKLAIALIERFTRRPAGARETRSNGDRWMDWRIRKAIGKIRMIDGGQFRIDDLAADTGMSRANFFRRFEASTGLTPGLFQNVLRVEQAIHLTTHTGDSIRTLSERLGFASQGHFTRFFRNHTAVAPRQFRSALARQSEAQTLFTF